MVLPLPAYAAVLTVVAVFFTAVFFLGPALAVHRAKQPLFEVLARSFGTWPGCVLRAAGLCFLVVWMADLVFYPAFGVVRVLPATLVWGVLGAIIAFLFFTGLQSFGTNAQLAFFSDKLGLAILLAALVRVHNGWPSVWQGRPNLSSRSVGVEYWHGLSSLAYDLAPLALLAAGLCTRIEVKKHVVLAGFAGIALPFFVVLLMIGVLNVAIYASGFYQPSLSPSVAMALFSRAANSGAAPRIMIAGITGFGAVRFGARAAVDAISFRQFRRRVMWVIAGIVGVTIVWVAMHRVDDLFAVVAEYSAFVLTLASAVITADLLTARTIGLAARGWDWVAVSALIIGGLVPIVGPLIMIGVDPYWHPWLLPSFATSFLVAFTGGYWSGRFRPKRG